MTEQEELLHVSVNQDQTFFGVGTQKGFKVFKATLQRQEELERELGAGVGIVELVHKTNIFALVGGGRTPRYHQNKLIIWDDCQLKGAIEINCKSQVRAVRIRHDRCVIVIDTKVFLFSFSDFRLLQSFQTFPNPRGVCGLSSLKPSVLLAFPSKKMGFIDIYDEVEKRSRSIEAHKSPLCAIEMCPNGYKVATASLKGTIIRIFDCSTGQTLQELRRGTEPANIYSMTFDLKSQYLVCSSNLTTIHIFAVAPTKAESEQLSSEPKNKKSVFSIFGKISSYFDSEWSMASYRCEQHVSKVFFLNKDNMLAIVNSKGIVSIVQFDPEKGGPCKLINEYALLNKP